MGYSSRHRVALKPWGYPTIMFSERPMLFINLIFTLATYLFRKTPFNYFSTITSGALTWALDCNTETIWLVSAAIENIAIGTGNLRSIPGPVKSVTVAPMNRHRCNVSSKLCCQAPSRRDGVWPLVTYFGVISRIH